MYEYRKLTPEERAELIRQRVELGYPPHAPLHGMRDELLYFITAACYEHRRHMNSIARRKQVLDLLFEHFISRGMELRAWIVLPNHYHLLVYTDDFNVIGKAIRRVHGATARFWNIEDDAIGRKVWYRYADRAIRSERHYYTTLNYIHYNPVKHHWVDSPYAWDISSLTWYLEAKGREWLRDLWCEYPLRSYGEGWDDFPSLEGEVER